MQSRENNMDKVLQPHLHDPSQKSYTNGTGSGRRERMERVDCPGYWVGTLTIQHKYNTLSEILKVIPLLNQDLYH